MKERLSDRINAMSESATIAMAQAARELASQGKDVISLSVGEPDFTTPKYIQDAANKAIADGYHFYTPVPGVLELRKAIAKKLNEENSINCSFENIVVSTGAKQCIANAVLSLINPGDEVIVLAPYWVSYLDIVKYAQGTPVLVHGTQENGFKPTIEAIKSGITDKTKAILFSAPSNPAGASFTKAELIEFSEMVLNHENLFVIADEIYEYINYEDELTSLASIKGMEDRVVTVNGFSKGFAMTGWRVGYLCAPLDVAKAAAKLQGQFTSGTNAIAQRASIVALEDKESKNKAVSEMLEAYSRRKDLMFDLLSAIPNVQVIKPSGAFYLFPNVSSYLGKVTPTGQKISNADDLSLYLLNEGLVSTVTGKAFGAEEHLRLSFATSDEKIKEAISRISAKLLELK